MRNKIYIKILLIIILGLGIFGLWKFYRYLEREKSYEIKYQEAKSYFLGEGKERDCEKTVEILKELLDADVAEAYTLMACVHYMVPGHIDYSKAINYLEKSVKKGDIFALIDLAYGYVAVQGTDRQKVEKAHEYINEALKHNRNKALVLLSYMYGFGIAVPKDLKEALRLAERAEELDMPYAKRYVCIFSYLLRHESDEYGKKAFTKALELRGNRDYVISYILSNLCIEGKVTPRDLNAGLYFLQMSIIDGYTSGLSELENMVSLGNSYASYCLGLVYYMGSKDIPEDNKKAYSLFEEASNKGVSEATYMLGVMHVLGEGKDEEAKVLEYARKSYESGYIPAKFLNILVEKRYIKGEADEKEILRKSHECIKELEEKIRNLDEKNTNIKGDLNLTLKRICMTLGVMYIYEFDGRHGTTEGIKCLKRSQTFVASRKLLMSSYMEGLPAEERNPEEAYYWYLKIRNENNINIEFTEEEKKLIKEMKEQLGEAGMKRVLERYSKEQESEENKD